MKYDEFHKLIEEQNPEKKQFLFKCAMDGLSLPAEIWNTESPSATAETQCGAPACGVSAATNATAAQNSESQTATAAQKPAKKPAGKWRNFFKQPARLAACVSAAVAVACLAIILPFTLGGRNGLQATIPSTSDTPSISENRYCAAAACKEIELKYSLKEYSARNNLSLLYIDWNDKADIKTSLHINNEDQTDIVYYEEILKHKGTGSIAELYITDLRTKVDKVEEYKKTCIYQHVPQRPTVKVFWGCDMLENGEPDTYQAYFTFVKYEYTLVLRYAMSENSIFELIDSMLPPWNFRGI